MYSPYYIRMLTEKYNVTYFHLHSSLSPTHFGDRKEADQALATCPLKCRYPKGPTKAWEIAARRCVRMRPDNEFVLYQHRQIHHTDYQLYPTFGQRLEKG